MRALLHVLSFCFCLAALTLALESDALAQAPRANSPEECATYADLALVATTLAKHGVPRPDTEAMLPDLYAFATPEALEIAHRVLEVAYRVAAARGAPRMFAEALGRSCLSRGGDLSQALGVRL